jgi:hypothetical protein
MAKLTGKERYLRRIERGLASGKSRAAARGHAPAHERAPAADRRMLRERDQALSRGLNRVIEGESLTAVAKALHVSRERFRRFVEENAEIRRVGGRYEVVRDKRINRLPLYTKGNVRTVRVDYDGAKLVGRFMGAVRRFLASNDVAYLRPFDGESVIDVSGIRHPFETSPEVLYMLDARDEAQFYQIYNTQQSEQ